MILRLYRTAWLVFAVWLFSAAAYAGQLTAAKPWLGVAIDKGPAGVLIQDVLSGTPAATAGIKSGDEILSVDDAKVHTPEELIAAIQSKGVGNSVKVRLRRAGKDATRTVKLVARPDDLQMLREQLVGKPAPAFDLPVVRGDKPGSLAKLKGKVAIVEFWATWCPACRSTHQRLSEFARTHNIAVLAISDEDESVIKAYTDKVKPAFTVLRDPKQEVAGKFMVSAIPMLAVVGKDGRVAFATVGAGSYMEEALATAEKLAKHH